MVSKNYHDSQTLTLYGNASGQSNFRIDGITKTSYTVNFNLPPLQPRTEKSFSVINPEQQRVPSQRLQKQHGETPPLKVQQEQSVISNT